MYDLDLFIFQWKSWTKYFVSDYTDYRKYGTPDGMGEQFFFTVLLANQAPKHFSFLNT